MLQPILLSLLATIVSAARYEEYILAPSSRTLHPATVYNVNGTVTNAASLTEGSSGSASFRGPSAVTYDFAINIAGIVSLEITSADADQYIGLTYSESSLWISGEGSDATADAGIDETLWFHITDPGTYTVDRKHERGGFRYLSLIHNTTGSVEVGEVTVHYTPMPHWEADQLKAYTGWFHCNDELVNRIWYAGAYTNQICTIDPNWGNSLVHFGEITSDQEGDRVGTVTWYNNFTITNGSSALVDGAKRDRIVWPGDMAIAVPTLTVSTYDLVTVVNSLDSLFDLQNSTTGELPYAGRPFPLFYSATYHLYSLIGVADYYLYSGDIGYLQGKWSQWKAGLNYSLSFIDNSGMMNVTSPADWLRFGMGGHNIEANSILYYTINQGIMLGGVLNEDASLLNGWAQQAATIRESANRLLWNETAGLYHDNETTTLMPQDGNSWAVVSDLADTDEKKAAISAGLSARWGPYGAPAPEADDAVSPFISGFELQTHFLAGNASAALELVRLQWGFMLDDPRMTNSTFIEGYAADGELHYAPYTNDPRVSHAHGWATGPTGTLVFEFGGIHLLTAAGRTWEIAPALGGLTTVDTGFETTVGLFSSQVNASTDGTITGMKFVTPAGTMGSVRLPGVSGQLMSENGTLVSLVAGTARNVSGGTWTLRAAGAPVQAEGKAASGTSMSALVIAAGILALLL
ncbi:hypothetical protein LTR37_014224 [Vermiconidia calcicola]|uniref:Uncharacterized protein n=1 Tax=Vermiconidia calcicola TaxID=1690605 RepID=A0ACC3MU53_9PEZI|nr:hypothetical protein LTR37_014224 [Vermiconidia calcicola]